MTTDVVLSDSIIDSARELRRIRDQLGKLKRSETQLRDSIMSALDGAPRGLTASGMPVAHVETQHRRGVSRDKLEAMYPEVFEAVMEETEVKVLKIDLMSEVTL
jgi:hypothetical protein